MRIKFTEILDYSFLAEVLSFSKGCSCQVHWLIYRAIKWFRTENTIAPDRIRLQCCVTFIYLFFLIYIFFSFLLFFFLFFSHFVCFSLWHINLVGLFNADKVLDLVWFGLALWYIINCWLFHVKFCFYI